MASVSLPGQDLALLQRRMPRIVALGAGMDSMVAYGCLRPKADVASWTEITNRLIEKSLSFVCNDIHKLIKPLVTVV